MSREEKRWLVRFLSFALLASATFLVAAYLVTIQFTDQLSAAVATSLLGLTATAFVGALAKARFSQLFRGIQPSNAPPPLTPSGYVVVFWVLLPLFAWVIWEAFFRVLHILGALVLGVLAAPAVVAAVWAAACAVAAAILTFWVLRYGWRQVRAESRSAAQQGNGADGP
jgi:hypothetical protein